MKNFLSILMLFISCGQRNTTAKINDTNHSSIIAIQNPIATYLKDTSFFTHIKYDFYNDSSGTIFWRYIDNSAPDTSFVNYSTYFCQSSLKKKIYFKDFLDIDTYEQLDSCLYSIDKNHVFYFRPCSCGGHFWIVEDADPKTFQHAGSYKEGFDKNYFYYEGERKEKRKNRS